MNFDLRLPIGLMFGVYGLVLTGYGAMTSGSDIYTRSLGININLGWGLVMLAFGVVMLLLAWKGSKKKG